MFHNKESLFPAAKALFLLNSDKLRDFQHAINEDKTITIATYRATYK